MTTLVTGATGQIGRHVVEQLLAEGEEVRVVTRKPESAGFPADVAVLAGDLKEPDSIVAAVKGADRVFLFPVSETATEVAEILARAQVSRVVVLSSLSIVEDPDNPSSRHHLAVERAVAERGLDWTFIRPTGFATNLLWRWGDAIRNEGVVRSPYGRSARALIHEADIAAVSSVALLHSGHSGKKYDLTGPGLVTQFDQVRLIGDAIGREITFQEVTPEQAREMMIKSIPESFADMLLAGLRRQVEDPGPVLATVEQVTGRSATSFARWAMDHAADFR
jgi:uncharacterized protein YbjT (DUF2867 family)